MGPSLIRPNLQPLQPSEVSNTSHPLHGTPSLTERWGTLSRQSNVCLPSAGNTPTEGVGSSPAQRFLGRRCRMLLPVTEALLQPEYDTMADSRALRGKRAKQAYYYNRQARDLPSITVGEAVRLRLSGDRQWTAGVCTGMHGPRSYIVHVGEAEYRRNRCHLLKGGVPPTRDLDMPPLPGRVPMGN